MRPFITSLFIALPFITFGQAKLFVQGGPVLAKGYNGIMLGAGIKTTSAKDAALGAQLGFNYINLGYRVQTYYKYNVNFVNIDALAAVTTFREKDVNLHFAGGLALLMNVGKVTINNNKYTSVSSALMPKIEMGVGFSRAIFKVGMYIAVQKSLKTPLITPAVAIYPFFKKAKKQKK